MKANVTTVVYGLLVTCLLLVQDLDVVCSKEPGNKDLADFDLMVECRLGYNGLYYNNYGCWCGVGGSGVPVDGIDTCCMHHDHCYERAKANGDCANTAVEYIEPYLWRCLNHTIICDFERNNRCQRAVCTCDHTVVNCWSQYPRPDFFNKPSCPQP